MKKSVGWVLVWMGCLFILPTMALGAVKLAMDVNPSTAKPGDTVIVSMTVVNDGDTTTGAVTLEMGFPENLNVLSTSYIATGGDANTVYSYGNNCNSGELVTWSLGALPPGGGVTVTMPPVVNGNTVDGTLIPFAAVVKTDGVQQMGASQNLLVKNDPFFELTVEEATDPVTTNGYLEYVLTYGNISTSASNTQLTFPLPEGTSFISATGGGTQSDGTVTWDLGSLISGEGGQRRVTVQVSADEGTLLAVAGAKLCGTDAGYEYHEAVAGCITRVDDDERPLLAMNINPLPVQAGEALAVEMTISNPGDTTLSNVTLILRYPSHLDVLSTAYITTGGDANTVYSYGDNCSSWELVEWNLGNLRPGGGVTVTLPPVVQSNTQEGTLISFDAEVRVDGIQRVSASKTMRVTADPFFTLNVAEATDPVTTNGDLEYVLTYGNISTSTSNTQLTFPLPDGTSFVSATAGGTESDGMVTWDLGSLISGEGGQCRVAVRVSAGKGALLRVHDAKLSGTDSGYEYHEVSVGCITRVEDELYPLLGMTVNPTPVRANDPLAVKMTVTNPGDATLSNVTLILRYPSHLDVLSTSYITTGGDANTVYSYGNNCNYRELVTWTIGNLRPGGGVTVTLPPVVDDDTPAGTLIPFEAEVRVDGIQRVSMSKTTRVTADPFFTLNVAAATDPVVANSYLEYVLTYGNISTSTTNTQLIFPLPDGTRFVSGTGGGTETDGDVIWPLGSMASGETGQRRVMVQVLSDEGALLKVDGASLSGRDAGYMIHEMLVGCITRVEDDERPQLAMNINPMPVQAGEALAVEMTVRNPGAAVMNNVSLMLRYPPHLNVLYTSYITTGGDANTVYCYGNNCNDKELVIWDLNNLPAGGSVTVTLPPVVNGNTPDGTLIQFDVEARVDGIQQLSGLAAVPVGTVFNTLPWGCAAPRSLTVPSTDSDGDYQVSWSVSATAGVAYLLEEATDAGFTNNLRTAYSGVSTEAAISGRMSGTTYYYRVKAMLDSYTDSDWQHGANGCTVSASTHAAYTKLDANGASLADDAADWAMVRDNATGLIWEIKTEDGGIHDKGHVYTWQAAQDTFIAQLNAENFGGRSDWRLPTIKELQTIVAKDRFNPAADSTGIAGTMSADYWTATSGAGHSDSAWAVNFYAGGAYGRDTAKAQYVRAVCGETTTAYDDAIDSARLTDNGDGTVTDTQTGLMWQQAEPGLMTWEAALTYSENLQLAGYEDWRLPNANELQSIVDYTLHDPAGDTTAFPDVMAASYWTSTSFSRLSDAAWGVHFTYGLVGYFNKSSMLYFRVVRGGQ